MLGNADTILNIEGPGFAAWQPTTEQLAKVTVPITLIFAEGTLPVYKEVTNWLAGQLNIQPISVPGRHGFYYYRPQGLADVLRQALKGLRGTGTTQVTLVVR